MVHYIRGASGMVFNVRRFSTASLPAEFYDLTGNFTTPSSATLTITYAATSGVIGSTVIAMTQVGASFVGNWGAGNSDLGLATYSISGAGQVTPTTGLIRVLSSHV
jgi:hypothetical protein